MQIFLTWGTLQTFISYCFYILHIRTSSIRGYLSALRYHCSTVGLQDPLRHSDGRFKFSLRTLLHATKKGQRGPRPCRLPIDIDILSRLCSLLNGGYLDLYWDCLLKASFCVAFFGFLRCGEFTTNSLNATAPVSIDDLTLAATNAALFLQRSKSSRFIEVLLSDTLERTITFVRFDLSTRTCVFDLHDFLKLAPPTPLCFLCLMVMLYAVHSLSNGYVSCFLPLESMLLFFQLILSGSELLLLLPTLTFLSI